MRQLYPTKSNACSTVVFQINRCFQWLLALLLLAPLAQAQAQTWQMAVGTDGGSSIAYATATDDSGNVYLAGSFNGTVNFGSSVLTSAGSDDFYVAKWSAVGDFMWAQRAGGLGHEHANAIAVRGNEVYVTGVFNSPSATFGTIVLTNADPNGITNDSFIVKFTDAGTSSRFSWAQSFGGTGGEFANGVAVSGNSVYVTGLFSSATVSFGATTLTSAGSADAFVAKLTDAGTSSHFVWARRAGGSGYDLGVGLAVNGSNVYVAGSFSGTVADFGSINLANSSAASNADDVFVAKLVDNGPTASFVWVQQAGGASYDQVTKMTVSGASVYVAGRFYSPTATFGNVTLTNANTNISEDGFITKITDAGLTGSFNWTQQVSSIGRDYIRAVAVHGNSVYVSGDFQNTATLGSNTLVSAGGTDAFVAKLTDQGNHAVYNWAQRVGGLGNEYGYGVALNGPRVYLAGVLASPVNFGSHFVTGSVGAPTSFLAGLTESAALATTASTRLEGLELYPNPAHGATTVLVPGTPGGTVATLTLTDAVGRVVGTSQLALPAAGLRHGLDLTQLPAGIYSLRVAVGSSVGVSRLAVE